MRKLFFLFIFLLFFCRYGYSENSRFYDSGQLTCNLMTTICQDARGFVWIGTEYGLNKFDGVQFTQYLNKENDATSLLGNIVNDCGWDVAMDYNIIFRRKMYSAQSLLKKT